MNDIRTEADVCLILEGTYPYVSGGVSTWIHDLIKAQSALSFHLITLVPDRAERKPYCHIPDNVLSVTRVAIGQLSRGDTSIRRIGRLFRELEEALSGLQPRGGLDEFAKIIEVLKPYRRFLGREILLNSEQAWEMSLRMYHRTMPRMPFLEYFWSWRAALSGLYSVLFTELPKATIYHTISTGYAGLLAARAHLEQGSPALLTEHGIYTNERRIEIALSGWPYETPIEGYQIKTDRRDLKKLWIETFLSYSRICYQACSKIITLYEGNQQLQLNDGASPEKMRIIPNGIDYPRFSAIERDSSSHPPTIALIGRVVPIKDVKTFIRACAVLRAEVPDVRAWILGPTDEERDYYDECRALVERQGLGDVVSFKGKVKLDEYLGRIDAMVLTSLSEAQPLVILEAGAAGIPTVATHVGSCRELILGSENESPRLGPGGAVTPLANPTATALALTRLLSDRRWYEQCSNAIRRRVATYYNKKDLDPAYRNLYRSYLAPAEPRMQSLAGVC